MPLPQSYFIFSIGNITPIFQTTYKDCYKQYKTCPESLVNAETYVQVLQAARIGLPPAPLCAALVLQPACQKRTTSSLQHTPPACMHALPLNPALNRC